MVERAAPADPRRQSGLSLVELMVAVAIGLFIVAVVLKGYAASVGSALTNSQVSELQTNGRYALEVLKREIRHAGLRGLVWDSAKVSTTTGAATRDFGCGAGVTTSLLSGMRGWNDTNPYAGSCLAGNASRSYARGDVLLLRRTSLDPVTALDANAPYLRAAYSTGSIFLGGEAASGSFNQSADYRLLSDVYFVNAFTNSGSEDPLVPALYRLRLANGANPTLVPELVAANVEHLQLQFGESDGEGNLRYSNASAVSDWARVNTVRVWLLMRSSRPEGGLTSPAYTLGDVTYTPNDNYRRAVLTTTVEVRNTL